MSNSPYDYFEQFAGIDDEDMKTLMDAIYHETVTNCPDCGTFLWQQNNGYDGLYLSTCPHCGWPAEYDAATP